MELGDTGDALHPLRMHAGGHRSIPRLAEMCVGRVVKLCRDTVSVTEAGTVCVVAGGMKWFIHNGRWRIKEVEDDNEDEEDDGEVHEEDEYRLCPPLLPVRFLPVELREQLWRAITTVVDYKSFPPPLSSSGTQDNPVDKWVLESFLSTTTHFVWKDYASLVSKDPSDKRGCSLDSFIDSLAAGSQLRSLDLSPPKLALVQKEEPVSLADFLTDDMLLKILKACSETDTHQLILQGCHNIEDKSILFIAKRFKNLQLLGSWIHPPTHTPMPLHLHTPPYSIAVSDLSQCWNVTGASLATLLSSCTQLQTLNVRGCSQIGPTLLRSLSKSKSVRCMELGESDNIASIFKMSGKVKEGWISLNELRIAWCALHQDLFPSLTRLSSLRVLNFHSCTVMRIEQVLAAVRSLPIQALTFREMDGDFRKTFIEAAKLTTLQSLSLDECRHVEAVEQALPAVRTKKKQFYIEKEKKRAQREQRNNNKKKKTEKDVVSTSLKHLSLRRLCGQDFAVETFAELFALFPTLELLHIKGSYFPVLQMRDFWVLSRSCPQLRSLKCPSMELTHEPYFPAVYSRLLNEISEGNKTQLDNKQDDKNRKCIFPAPSLQSLHLKSLGDNIRGVPIAATLLTSALSGLSELSLTAEMPKELFPSEPTDAAPAVPYGDKAPPTRSFTSCLEAVAHQLLVLRLPGLLLAGASTPSFLNMLARCTHLEELDLSKLRVNIAWRFMKCGRHPEAGTPNRLLQELYVWQPLAMFIEVHLLAPSDERDQLVKLITDQNPNAPLCMPELALPYPQGRPFGYLLGWTLSTIGSLRTVHLTKTWDQGEPAESDSCAWRDPRLLMFDTDDVLAGLQGNSNEAPEVIWHPEKYP